MREFKETFKAGSVRLRGPRVAHPATGILVCVAAAAWCGNLAAAEIDPAQLPPPAGVPVDFNRDVRSIFEKTCFRCHGPEKPKSHFRLDNRDSALKGGNENSDDIIPGDSAHSRLIHYVTRLVPDMEMPPPDRGKPLTREQIGVLRAWIDQGAHWGATNSFPELAFSVSPALRWIGVGGDKKKFREVEGVKEGWGGGAERFAIRDQLSPDEGITAEGHVLFPDNDIRVTLALEKTDVGFIRGGFEEWRRYYDDTGGFYRPFTPPSFDLNRDLHLDIGRAWIDFGLTMPRLPRIVLGYEYQFKDGAKAMLEWGGVYDQNFVGRNIYPAAKAVHEHTHILKLDVTHGFYGWRFVDSARVEFYTDRTRDEQVLSYTTGPSPDAIVRTRQDFSHVQGANTVRLEKQITDWCFLSGGYLYSRLEGDSSLNQITVDGGYQPVFGPEWRDQVTLQREMHALSAASMFLPLDGLSLSLGAQNEWVRQKGFGDIHLDVGDPNDPGSTFAQPATVRSDLDEVKTAENAELRYTKIPFTVLFAQGRFAQDRIGQFEEEAGSSPDTFLRNTDYFNQSKDLRAGFSVSPWRWLALNADYRHRNSDSDYNHLRDESPLGGEGYSAFIRHRDINADEVEARLVLRPAPWLKTTFTYRQSRSEFFTATDLAVDSFYGNISPGGRLLGGIYDLGTYGLSMVLTPVRRWYFTGTFTYSDSRTTTWAQEAVPGVIVPYGGGIYNVMTSANYALNSRTTLRGSYAFSEADYGEGNVADGLPLGLSYTRHNLSAGLSRRLTQRVILDLRYSYYRYAEPSTGGHNDFTARGIFAMAKVKWP